MSMAQGFFKKIRHPEIFQGAKQRKSYFEGWYFKNVSKDTTAVWAIIPGIAIDKQKNKKAFIQFINGKNAETIYLEFDHSMFQFSSDSFFISIGKNTFSKRCMHLDIDQDGYQIKGDLFYSNLTSLPQHSLLSSNVMGPFAFLPMQCSHGILSMNHDISGRVTINDRCYDLQGGKGYIEKDWGTSFPERYVWMQSNHFSNNQTSLCVSLASIPKLGIQFTGILGVLLLNGKYHQFYTYNHSKIKSLVISDNQVKMVLKRKRERLEINIERKKSGSLHAPFIGTMDRKIAESIDAVINYQLFVKNKLVSEGLGSIAGLEIVNMKSSTK